MRHDASEVSIPSLADLSFLYYFLNSESTMIHYDV